MYKGEYNHTDVAVKKVHEKMVTQKDLAAFEVEARLMGELPPHPNGTLKSDSVEFTFLISGDVQRSDTSTRTFHNCIGLL